MVDLSFEGAFHVPFPNLCPVCRAVPAAEGLKALTLRSACSYCIRPYSRSWPATSSASAAEMETTDIHVNVLPYDYLC